MLEFIQDEKNYEEGVKLGIFKPKVEQILDNGNVSVSGSNNSTTVVSGG